MECKRSDMECKSTDMECKRNNRKCRKICERKGAHKADRKQERSHSLPMDRKGRCVFAGYMALVLVCCFGMTAFAEDDPLTVVNNLSDFIFGLIRAVGMILLGFGVVQIGLSLKSHDPSQRANGFLTLAGGVVITFAKEILNLITG